MQTSVRRVHAVCWLALGMFIACSGRNALGQTPGVVPRNRTLSPECKTCTTTTLTITTLCTATPTAKGDQPPQFELRPKNNRVYLYVRDGNGYPVGAARLDVLLAPLPGNAPGRASSLISSPCVTDSGGVCSVTLPSALSMVSLLASCSSGCIGRSSRALLPAR